MTGQVVADHACTPCCPGDAVALPEPGDCALTGDRPAEPLGSRRAAAPSVDSCSSPSRRMAASMSVPQS